MEDININDDSIIDAPYSEVEPTQHSIAQIAEKKNMSASTVRMIVQDMEKRNLLSTSNKVANKHRKLTNQDNERISRVIDLTKEGLTTAAAISEVAAELQIGEEKSVTQVFYQQQHTSKEVEMIATIVKVINSLTEESKELMEKNNLRLEHIDKLIEENRAHEEGVQQKLAELAEMNQKQGEQIEKLSQVIAQRDRDEQSFIEINQKQSAQIEELKGKLAEKEKETVGALNKQIEMLNEKLAEKERMEPKRKKFLGIF